jgi:hypothetical protein
LPPSVIPEEITKNFQQLDEGETPRRARAAPRTCET